MAENPFVKQGVTWQPPNRAAPNPYRQAKIVKQVVEVAPMVIPFPTANFDPTERASPYISAEEYQAQTGVKLSAENANSPPDQNKKKISAPNEGKEVAEKFIVRLNGIYLKPKNKLTEDERRLCNFSFAITAIRVLRNRDGTVQREVVYNVISSDLAHRADEFDEKNLPSIQEEDFDKIIDEILHLFKETYICPESKNIARDYLREYGAIVYREFRRNHELEEFFSYHGRELVGDKMCYLSDSRALELYREECIDQTMVVDDIFKKKASNMTKFEDILRAFGEGIGRAKSAGKDFKEIIRTKVKGGCIVTAEHDLESQQSSALRYVSVPIESESIDTDALGEFQADKTYARMEGRPTIVQEIFAGWISYLELNYEQIVKFLIEFQPLPLTLKFKRHRQIYKVLCAVAALINEWGLQSRSINIQQYNDNYILWHRVIVELMFRNQTAATVAEPWQQFLVTLQQAIATSTALIAVTKDEFEQNGGKYVGFQRLDKDGAEYVLSPDKVVATARHLLADSGRELVSDSTTIFKELLNHGISKGYENKDGNGGTRKRYLKRVKLNDHLVEMLVLSKDAMERAIEKFLEEE